MSKHLSVGEKLWPMFPRVVNTHLTALSQHAFPGTLSFTQSIQSLFPKLNQCGLKCCNVSVRPRGWTLSWEGLLAEHRRTSKYVMQVWAEGGKLLCTVLAGGWTTLPPREYQRVDGSTSLHWAYQHSTVFTGIEAAYSHWCFQRLKIFAGLIYQDFSGTASEAPAGFTKSVPCPSLCFGLQCADGEKWMSIYSEINTCTYQLTVITTNIDTNGALWPLTHTHTRTQSGIFSSCLLSLNNSVGPEWGLQFPSVCVCVGKWLGGGCPAIIALLLPDMSGDVMDSKHTTYSHVSEL